MVDRDSLPLPPDDMDLKEPLDRAFHSLIMQGMSRYASSLALDRETRGAPIFKGTLGVANRLAEPSAETVVEGSRPSV